MRQILIIMLLQKTLTNITLVQPITEPQNNIKMSLCTKSVTP